MNSNRMQEKNNNEKRSGCAKTALLVIVIAAVTSIITVWVAMAYLFPKEFKPVSLSDHEEKILDEKLARLDTYGSSGKASLKPERYSEEGR